MSVDRRHTIDAFCPLHSCISPSYYPAARPRKRHRRFAFIISTHARLRACVRTCGRRARSHNAVCGPSAVASAGCSIGAVSPDSRCRRRARERERLRGRRHSGARLRLTRTRSLLESLATAQRSAVIDDTIRRPANTANMALGVYVNVCVYVQCSTNGDLTVCVGQQYGSC